MHLFKMNLSRLCQVTRSWNEALSSPALCVLIYLLNVYVAPAVSHQLRYTKSDPAAALPNLGSNTDVLELLVPKGSLAGWGNLWTCSQNIAFST